MSLKIYNTLSREKEIFKPLHDGKVSMYVCGMTVYDYCHLGHARVLVAFDVINRYLQAKGYAVNYVRNITDIDDKILQRANENGEAYTALTARFIAAMHEDEKRLAVLRPTQEPRATDYIEPMQAMIRTLEDKQFAYAADNGDVYYAVDKFKHYGALSGKKMDELRDGASERVTATGDKRDARDFTLWKAAKAGEAYWSSPWGKGRPGWHIECSAMSTQCLGDTFDIHGGGPDLVFPHHENEIAQSEAATGKKYVNYWMHAGAVRVDNEKMSKSLGNFFTIREILDKYHAEVVRYFLISSHYRSPINYSEDNLKEAKVGLDRFYQCLQSYTDVPALSLDALKQTSQWVAFEQAMDDDFNVREALSVMYGLVREVNGTKDAQQATEQVAIIKAMGNVLGILQADPTNFLQAGSGEDFSIAAIEQKIAEREAAKKAKNYALADQIRDELKAHNVVLADSAQGTTWRRE